jgi:antitoxin CptB
LRSAGNLAKQRHLMDQQTTELDTFRRKLLWRATHRGLKELDLVLGGFARQNVNGMSPAELDEFDAIVSLPDPELYGWLMGREGAPLSRWPMLSRILTFKP